MKNILIVLMIISFLPTGCNQSSDTSHVQGMRMITFSTYQAESKNDELF